MKIYPRNIAVACLLVVLSASGLSCKQTDGSTDTGAAGKISIYGAGATFPAPLYEKWIEVYESENPKTDITYDAVGSGMGIKRFMAEKLQIAGKQVEVAFGASDAAMTDEQIAAVKRGVQLVPMTAGSIVLAYNLDGVPELKLPRDVYVDIFLGKITAWDDPRIQRANPGVKFPSNTIAVVARQDSSGTTYAFTNHLSAISDAWRDTGPGTGKLIDWPGRAMLAMGNEGVAGRIKLSAGSIGYVEYGMASRTGLAMATLENKAGQFVTPSGNSGLATLQHAELPENLRAFFPDPDGADSYPIVTYSWLLLYKQYDDEPKKAAIKQFVRWCVTDGQQYNEPLGFIRLAPSVVSAALAALDQL